MKMENMRCKELKAHLSLDAGSLNERMKKADLVSYCFPHSLTQSNKKYHPMPKDKSLKDHFCQCKGVLLIKRVCLDNLYFSYE